MNIRNFMIIIIMLMVVISSACVPQRHKAVGASQVSNSASIVFEDFTGNGSQVMFMLKHTNPTHIKVFVGGSVIQKLGSDYTIEGSVVSFNTAPPEGILIRVSYQY